MVTVFVVNQKEGVRRVEIRLKSSFIERDLSCNNRKSTRLIGSSLSILVIKGGFPGKQGAKVIVGGSFLSNSQVSGVIVTKEGVKKISRHYFKDKEQLFSIFVFVGVGFDSDDLFDRGKVIKKIGIKIIR